MPTRAAIYAIVSTSDQSPDLQLQSLRAYATARRWAITEFCDHGVSGAKERRPALDALVAPARARKIDVVLATKLDRLARSTHHLVTLARELETLGVDLIVIDQAIDTTSPTGRLVFHVLAAISEFERALIVERVRAGVRRAKALGIRCGRPRKHEFDVAEAAALRAAGLSLSEIGRRLGHGVPIHATIIRKALAARA